MLPCPSIMPTLCARRRIPSMSRSVIESPVASQVMITSALNSGVTYAPRRVLPSLCFPCLLLLMFRPFTYCGFVACIIP
nr:MAG TPA: hypothetical protein [Caudoviricetes sp.]